VALVWRVVVKDAFGNLPLWGGHFLAKRLAPGSYTAGRREVDRLPNVGRHELVRRERRKALNATSGV
jgi:hypothetical protein